MFCQHCGAEIPDNGNFCFICGARVQRPAGNAPKPQPQPQPQPQPMSQPQPQQASSSAFGTKTISDRHYSLEDIARQQQENKNEIGLASAPPRPQKRKKSAAGNSGRQETSLPPIGASDSMQLDNLEQMLSAASAGAAASQPETALPMGAPTDAMTESTLESTLQPSPEAVIAEEQTVPQAMHAAPEVPVVAPAPTADQQASPQRKPDRTPVFRYTITVPPVPLGMQRQTRISLFGGNIGPQIEELRRSYQQKKQQS